MAQLMATLSAIDPLSWAGAVAIAFTLLATVAAGRALWASDTDLLRDRLRRLAGQPAAGRSSLGPVGAPGSFLQATLAPLSRIAMPGNAKELGRIRGRLSHAGYRSERALVAFMGSKVLLALALVTPAIWIQTSRPQPLQYAALLTVTALAVGFYLPDLWLSGRARERQRSINNAMPDALDLLVTCVEAGLALEAAMNRVAEEVNLSAPLLSQELSQTALEVQAGMPRADAFRRLAGRTGIDELRSLSAIIIQTQMFGTSIAQSLRVQADAMRVRRMQVAEERAAIVAVKLSFPLVFCILPSLFGVLAGPAVVSIVKVLLPKLGGEG